MRKAHVIIDTLFVLQATSLAAQEYKSADQTISAPAAILCTEGGQ
jgi:hypothetical protein